MKSTDDYVGAEIGNYRVGARIARGGFSTVYYGYHPLLERQVAIKVLHTTYLASPKEHRRFRQEAQFLEKLKHPHCLPVYDAGVLPIHEGGVDHEIPYLISQYAAHGSLRDRLKKAQGPLSLQDVLTVVSQVAEALHYAHQHGIIHRDLKPENILFDEHDNALLADFGLTMVLKAASTQPASRAGTPGYMAPEQFEGIVSRRSDQYALGCITYELLTGHLPYAPSSDHAANPSVAETAIPLPPSTYNPSIPPAVERVLLKSLERQHKARYANILVFLKALQACLSSSVLAPNDSSRSILRDEGASQPPLFSWVLFEQGRFEEALVYCERTLLLDATCAAAYDQKGRLFRVLGKAKEANQAFERAKQLGFYKQ